MIELLALQKNILQEKDLNIENQWLPRGWAAGMSKIDEKDEEAQTSSYKVDKSWGGKIQHKRI